MTMVKSFKHHSHGVYRAKQHAPMGTRYLNTKHKCQKPWCSFLLKARHLVTFFHSYGWGGWHLHLHSTIHMPYGGQTQRSNKTSTCFLAFLGSVNYLFKKCHSNAILSFQWHLVDDILSAHIWNKANTTSIIGFWGSTNPSHFPSFQFHSNGVLSFPGLI